MVNYNNRAVRYSICFIFGFGSLLTGASIVHNIYKPDLVRFGNVHAC